ncbi:hypothetical protein WEH80_33210 [Actinomycetes bacterium KLBMP 9759]
MSTPVLDIPRCRQRACPVRPRRAASGSAHAHGGDSRPGSTCPQRPRGVPRAGGLVAPDVAPDVGAVAAAP